MLAPIICCPDYTKNIGFLAPLSVRKSLSKCVVCRSINATPGQQQMADLPLDRVSPDEPPFTYVGFDHYGPFGVTRGGSVVKCYGFNFMFSCKSNSH